MRFSSLLLCALLACVAGLTSCSSPVPPLATIRKQVHGEILPRAVRFGLVDVQRYVPGVEVDLRYESDRNVTNGPFYPAGLPCLLERDTAEKLRQAEDYLDGRGYHLRIWDAFRPVEGHQVLWEKFGVSGYVHEPGFENRWSWHCYGRAVDVTVVDRWGRPIEMPSDFDEFSPKAWAGYTGGNPKVAANLRMLQAAMQRSGFEMLLSEWWHFSNPTPGHPGRPVYAQDLGLNIETKSAVVVPKVL